MDPDTVDGKTRRTRSSVVKLTHLGHACLLVETDGARLLIDPGTYSSFEELRDLDAVLVTHQHADHVDAPRLSALLAANPGARLVVDPDSVAAVIGLPADHLVARPGDRLTFGGSTVEVTGGMHAAVYGPVPGCTNSSYLVDDGAFFHPGDSFFVPDRPIDVLAVAVDGPWLKLSEAVDYVHTVSPRVAVPIHEGGTSEPEKYAGMLGAFSPEGVVRRLVAGERSAV
jgi:L-ascorbate metabolism protein UlaG (beta-lactamase superfamily)